MGGQSFKCPQCERWFLARGALHNHLLDKHKEEPGFSIEGVANRARIYRPLPCLRRDISECDSLECKRMGICQFSKDAYR